MHQWIAPVARIEHWTGLDAEEFLDVVGPALLTSPDRTMQLQAINSDRNVSRAVRFLILHSASNESIAEILALRPHAIALFRTSQHAPTPKAQRVVKLAKEGHSATEIRRTVGNAGKGWLYRVFDQAKVEPHPFGARAATNPEQRARVVRMYRRGDPYAKIADVADISLSNVKNVLRAAHKRGELPEYGSRWNQLKVVPDAES